jgi:hypothetical protein
MNEIAIQNFCVLEVALYCMRRDIKLSCDVTVYNVDIKFSLFITDGIHLTKRHNAILFAVN